MTNEDQLFMKKALILAKKGMSWTRPNPLVGAVIVRDGEIIGQGYHTRCGEAHAEVEAIRSTKKSTKGATMYVTLEPCCHTGKTPPCTEAVIKAGIKKVICAHLDPHLVVAGKGVAALRAQGIEVEVGLMEKESREMNEGFVTYHSQKRPFIVVKFAASLDGKIATATGDSKWITSEESREYSRSLRARYDAILVGKNTILHDDPNLGCQNPQMQDPLRIILDSNLSTPLTAQVFRDNNVLVATTQNASQKRVNQFTKKGIEVLVLKGKQVPIPELLKKLTEKKIQSVFIEGGGRVLGSFVDAQLVDKVYAFHAPIIIGGVAAKNAVGGVGAETIFKSIKLSNVSRKVLGKDILTVGDIFNHISNDAS
ncbi:MAG: bifunctional diaminohydroxyphosphoribosylaminopyrimidine deaminase/5-amino-6-(5-phosphoribosylamino)uracil reductase RibD [Patescibacteria group bacterium]